MSKVNLDSTVLAGIVSYMQNSDAVLSKQASFENAVSVAADKIASYLVEANIVSGTVKEASISKLKTDPTYAVELLEKVASTMTLRPAGKAADRVKSASVAMSADEAFDNVLLS